MWRTASVVIGVGANRGQYAERLRAAGYAGPLISIEPLRKAFDALEDTAAADPSWRWVRAAVGDRPGRVTLHASANDECSSVLPLTDEGRRWAKYVDDEQVGMVRLDDLGLADERPYLKIDVQGYEAPVLRGATDTLSRAVGVEAQLSLVELYRGQKLAADGAECCERPASSRCTWPSLRVIPGPRDLAARRRLRSVYVAVFRSMS